MRSATLLSIPLAFGLAACGKDTAPATPDAAEAAKAEPKQGDDHPHAAGHEHEAPHGGIVATAGVYHLEAVETKMGLVLYLLDEAEKELPVEGVSGRIVVSAKDGKPPVQATLSPMGNHLMTDVTVTGDWSAVATVTIKGQTVTARFEGGGEHEHGHGHEHGEGDHGREHGHEHEHGEGEHGAAAFTCPMHPEVSAKEPGQCPKCGMDLVSVKGDGHDHGAHAMPEMKLSTTVASKVVAEGVLEAGKPSSLRFSYHALPGEERLADFEVTHERRLHVFIVSEDMSLYAHEHPEPSGPETDGVWALSYTFPAPGKYRVYSDFKSTSRGANVTVSELVVPGEAPPAKPLIVDTEGKKTWDGLAVTFAPSPAPIRAGATTTLSYTVHDAAGAPVTDLEPYLGAMGHLFVLGEDLVTMAHSHPEGMEKGPEVKFMAVLPKPGKYKLWAQFQRGGQIVTTDWVIAVE